MISVILGIIFITAGVLLAEHFGRKKLLKQESSRKIPHVVSSLAIATVALFISIQTMEILLVIYTVIALIIIRLNLFSVARAVNRLSWGELFFPLGLIAAAFISPTKWVFIASTLVMGLADATAALVGTAVGKHKYKVLGHSKSAEGSLAFFATTIAILVIVIFIAPSGLSAGFYPLILITLGATVLEGITPWGLDNLLLPGFIAWSLTML